MTTTTTQAPPIVRNVKLVGFESQNGRIYPASVLKDAVKLYEGTRVNIDHPDGNPNKPRRVQDRFGMIRNARFVEGSGIHGDFHFNPMHSYADEFRWYVENDPGAFGFSHNALMQIGRPRPDGCKVIEKIISVKSVDLVADPATTGSIFESFAGRPQSLTVRLFATKLIGPQISERVATRFAGRLKR